MSVHVRRKLIEAGDGPHKASIVAEVDAELIDEEDEEALKARVVKRAFSISLRSPFDVHDPCDHPGMQLYTPLEAPSARLTTNNNNMTEKAPSRRLVGIEIIYLFLLSRQPGRPGLAGIWQWDPGKICCEGSEDALNNSCRNYRRRKRVYKNVLKVP